MTDQELTNEIARLQEERASRQTIVFSGMTFTDKDLESLRRMSRGANVHFRNCEFKTDSGQGLQVNPEPKGDPIGALSNLWNYHPSQGFRKAMEDYAWSPPKKAKEVKAKELECSLCPDRITTGSISTPWAAEHHAMLMHPSANTKRGVIAMNGNPCGSHGGSRGRDLFLDAYRRQKEREEREKKERELKPDATQKPEKDWVFNRRGAGER